METPKHSLINIAPLAEVTISSKSKWSTDDDEREIVTAEHDRNFSFHTDLEESPWILVDLKRDYRISHIRILNRLDYCKEKAKSLRIEDSNDKENYNILSDMNEVWGDALDIPVKDIDIRFLRFSLKEEQNFHLKKIEIFTDSEFIIQNCVDNKEKGIVEICDLIYQEFCKKFIISIYDNFNQIILSDKSDIRRDIIRYTILFDGEDVIFNIVITSEHWKDLDFYLFITIKTQQLNYKIKKFKDKVCLVKRIIKNEIVEEIKYAILLVENTALYAFTKIINQRKIIANENLYKNNRNNIIIIDSDLISDVGFLDRLRGVLSIISICNSMNIDFFIKFL